MPINPIEKWLPVVGFENNYIISNFGNIKRLSRKTTAVFLREKAIKKFDNIYGYEFVRLSNNNIIKNKFIHRLVMEAFNPTNNKNLVVNHKDGNKHNNNLNNLEWVTQKENIKHAWNIGLSKRRIGEYSKINKLKLIDIYDIKNIYKNILSQKDIAKKYGVNQSTISRIINNKRWA